VALALASAQKAGLSVNGTALAELAARVGADPSASLRQRGLIVLLAGRQLTAAERSQLIRELAATRLQFGDAAAIERAVLALFTARLLDATVAAALEQQALAGLAASQVNSGKQAGSFTLRDNRPVAISARAYLLLSVPKGRWAAVK
jgi:hypothetical protein